MQTDAPFDISVHDPSPQLRELHFSFTAAFQQMDVGQRLESIRQYVLSLIEQAKVAKDPSTQKGIMTVVEISEQLLPHIQSDTMPLEQTLIVEIGDAGDGSSLEDLLKKKH